MGSLVVACELLVAACMWDLVPQPGMEPGPPALGAQSPIHCATREVPLMGFSVQKRCLHIAAFSLLGKRAQGEPSWEG